MANTRNYTWEGIIYKEKAIFYDIQHNECLNKQYAAILTEY